jgi:hypothetical protein
MLKTQSRQIVLQDLLSQALEEYPLCWFSLSWQTTLGSFGDLKSDVIAGKSVVPTQIEWTK